MVVIKADIITEVEGILVRHSHWKFWYFVIWQGCQVVITNTHSVVHLENESVIYKQPLVVSTFFVDHLGVKIKCLQVQNFQRFPLMLLLWCLMAFLKLHQSYKKAIIKLHGSKKELSYSLLGSIHKCPRSCRKNHLYLPCSFRQNSC